MANSRFCSVRFVSSVVFALKNKSETTEDTERHGKHATPIFDLSTTKGKAAFHDHAVLVVIYYYLLAELEVGNG